MVVDSEHLAVVESNVPEPLPRILSTDQPAISAWTVHRYLAAPLVADDGNDDPTRAHDHLAQGRLAGRPLAADPDESTKKHLYLVFFHHVGPQ